MSGIVRSESVDDAPPELVEAVAKANTGRHFLELCQAHNFMTPVQRVVELALQSCLDYIGDKDGQMAVEVILVDFDGTVLGRVAGGHTPNSSGKSTQTLVERLSADPARSYDEDWENDNQ